MTTSAPVKVGFERILVPIDFADVSQKAVEYAKSIARSYNSSIVLAHVNRPINPVTPPEMIWYDEVSKSQPMDQHLEDLGAELRSQGFQAAAVSLTGAIHDEILCQSQREHSDLIVLGTHGRTGVSRLLLGSDAEALYRHSTCPILVVGPQAKTLSPDATWCPRNIVYACDLDPDSIPIAAFACRLAEDLGATLTVLHVDQSHGEADRHEQLQQFKRTFNELLPDHKEPGCTWRTLMLGYGLGATIADFAVERNSDLIVMGAQTAFPAISHLAGGIAPQVLVKAPCPVMILHKPK